MATNKDDVTRAFPAQPHTFKDGDDYHFYEGSYGMTLRDYFAAAAMQGYCSLPWEEARKLVSNGDWPNRVATHSYLIADAMLAAREPPDA